MAKKITNIIKLNIPAGKGTPSPPVGPALGQAGINMMEFLKRYNEQTQEKMGFVLPVTITVYEDKSYAFIVKQPLTTDLIKREIGLDRGSQKPGRERSGTINREQLRAVAKLKMVDYNTNDEEMAMRIVAGSARSMGLDVDWDN